jgi:hypothetical protein
MGDYDRAGRLYRDGLRMAEDLGLWPEVSFKLSGLGRTALLTGDLAQAREFHERARRLAVEQSDRFGEQFAEIGLALGARRAGELDRAEAHLHSILDLHRQMGYEPGAPPLILDELGFIAEHRGDLAEARRLHLDGYATARTTGDPRTVALALEGLAGVEAADGAPARAARLLGCAAAARESVGAPLPEGERFDVDRITQGAREALGEGRFDTELSHGRNLSPDDCVAEDPRP